MSIKNRLELEDRAQFDDLCKLMEGVANFDFYDLKQRCGSLGRRWHPLPNSSCWIVGVENTEPLREGSAPAIPAYSDPVPYSREW